MDNKNSLIVVGEASESDDDDDKYLPSQETLEGRSVSFNGAVVVVGSESDSDDNFNITAEAFASKYEETKPLNSRYNTLLHKKLKESNNSLQEDVAELVKSCFRFANEQIREINSRIQEAQVEAVDVQKNLRTSLIAMERINWALNDIISTSFMSRVK